jgi:hypothetical protein
MSHRTRIYSDEAAMFFTLISFAIAVALGMAAYSASRSFVSHRLRFVDAVTKPFVPLLAGVGAAIVAMPVMGLLPFVGTGTALTIGLSVWAGVRSGVHEIRRSLGPGIN